MIDNQIIILSQLQSRAYYWKKQGTMCCIVPNNPPIFVMSKGIKETKTRSASSNNIQTHLNKKIMKTQNTNFLKTIGAEEMNRLVAEVKETVALHVPAHQKNAFGVVDLWNLERSRKTRIARRHFA